MLRKKLFDHSNQRSVSAQLRKQRFQLFMDMINRIPHPVSVLDIGGTQNYWEMMTSGSSLLEKVSVTLLNLQPSATSLPNLTSMVGDARSMPQFADQQYDFVFSNSTIEHVGSFSDQKNMADEVLRIGKQYYIQTPNRYFPIEPHFVFPFFQFLPISLRVFLVRNFKLGWFPKIPDYQAALSEVTSIRLMSKNEIKALFPNALIYEENYFGLTKSFVAYTPH